MSRTGFRTLLGAALVFGAVACSSSGSKAGPTTKADNGAVTAPSTAATTPHLTIVVTDDDGIGAPGIDELTRQLRALDDTTVIVVAPATNQSGTGDRTTPGGAGHRPGKTASGVAGTAVEGTPADSIGVALDDLKLHPDLVASGINRGQNVGPLAKLSGTVGAALTAARRGVPAIAGSAGFEENADYAGAAKLVVAWVTANRAKLAAHEMPTKYVVNINVPQCTKGTMGKLVQVAPAAAIPEGFKPFTADCTQPPANPPTDDVHAIAVGLAAETQVPIG